MLPLIDAIALQDAAAADAGDGDERLRRIGADIQLHLDRVIAIAFRLQAHAVRGRHHLEVQALGLQHVGDHPEDRNRVVLQGRTRIASALRRAAAPLRLIAARLFDRRAHTFADYRYISHVSIVVCGLMA